jgi:hypothetical protein
MCLGASYMKTTNPIALLLDITIVVSYVGYLGLTVYQSLKKECFTQSDSQQSSRA